MALAHFVKRLDFNTVACFASVAVACDDDKAEADLVWLALIELRRALAEAGAAKGDVPRSDPAALVSGQIDAAVSPPAKSDRCDPRPRIHSRKDQPGNTNPGFPSAQHRIKAGD
jgi:hypothetical protein